MNCRKKLLLTEKYHLFLLFTTVFSATACSSITLLSQFDMEPTPGPTSLQDDWEKKRKWMAAKMKAIEKENPQWKMATDNRYLLWDIYDENGKKIGSAWGEE